MTPNQLLESVKGRFPVLLHDEPAALQSLLSKAIGKYQDIAGIITTIKVNDENDIRNTGEYPLPDDFIARVSLKDANGRLVPSEVFAPNLELRLTGRETFPLRLTYFQNLLGADFDTVIVPASAQMAIADYLEILIAIPNTERNRRVAVGGKFDASDFSSEESLQSRLVELEAKIKESRAVLPTFSLY